MLERPMQANHDVQLSRVYADGWSTGLKINAYPKPSLAQVAALNPHKREPESTQWLRGFHEARAARHGARGMSRDQTRKSCLEDLVELLRAHPMGLRRWSVMREMRRRREKAGHEITLKFENEVELIFNRHCSGDARSGDGAQELFYRPKERSGDVWAANPDGDFSTVDGLSSASE